MFGTRSYFLIESRIASGIEIHVLNENPSSVCADQTNCSKKRNDIVEEGAITNSAKEEDLEMN